MNNERVDALFSSYSNGRGPGAAVMVIREGKVRLRSFYGLSDIERETPITGRTAFRLASLTKPFTAMAIMILVEKGRLRYDEPLSRFFPKFPAYARKITVRHLLNHMSGLPEYACLFVNAKDKAKRIDIDWPRSSLMKPSRYEPTSRDALAMLAREGVPQFEPGVKAVYNNSEYIVLAQIVEKVSRRRFRDFLAREIFRKAGMGHSVLDDESRPRIPGRAKGYTEGMCGRYRDFDYTPLNLVYGEDNIYTTLDDMYRWDQALELGKLVAPATFAEALIPGTLNDGERTEYGFGWLLERFLGFDAHWHNGEWAGTRSYHLRIPALRFAVIVLANCERIDATEIGSTIAQIYLGET